MQVQVLSTHSGSAGIHVVPDAYRKYRQGFQIKFDNLVVGWKSKE